MSKPIREVGQDKRADFNNAVSEILYAKSEIEKWQKYKVEMEEYLTQLCSVVEPTSDFEGTESMKSDKYQVGFVYRLIRKVDKKKADELLKDSGRNPEDFFNVKYDYSAEIFRELIPDDQRVIQDSMVTKRAKTSIEIKPLFIEGKEE